MEVGKDIENENAEKEKEVIIHYIAALFFLN